MVSYQSLGEFGIQSLTQLIGRGVGVSSRQIFSIAYPQPKQNYCACYIYPKKKKENNLGSTFRLSIGTAKIDCGRVIPTISSPVRLA